MVVGGGRQSMHVEVFNTTEVPGHDADETLGRIPGCCMGFEHPAYLDFVTPGALPDGYAADDGCALLWRGGRRRRG